MESADGPDPTPDQIKRVTALAKAQGIVGKEAIFVDLSAYMQTEVSAWSQINFSDAESYIKSLEETAEV